MRVTANQVTIARLCGLPFVAYAIYGDTRMRIIGAVVGTLIGLTDFLDGYLARKYGSTVLGSLLDPVADKVFIVVCYACYADRGGMPWWIAAAVLSRELLVTVLRSSLELRGRRLPSTIVAKAKTWVQMIGFGLYALVPIVGGGSGLQLLFAVPLAVALVVIGLALVLRKRGLGRAFAFAAAVLAGFLAASLVGKTATLAVVAGFVILMTWYSALDYLALGFRELSAPGEQRAVLGAPHRGRPHARRRADGDFDGASTDHPDHPAAVVRHGPRRARQLRREPTRRRLLVGRQPLGGDRAAAGGAGHPVGRHRPDGGGGRHRHRRDRP
jgi:CDP-diacylglycerol--glycerol-3-phosphate 3-phosphatidyltransferase